MNDSISRQAALTALNGCTEIFLNNLPPTIYKTDAVEAVTALPSAQPDVPDTNVGDMISRQAAIELIERMKPYHQDADDIAEMIANMPSAQPVEDVRAMCSECDAWNKYKNYPQQEQFNPCTVCQEFDCTGCKFRRT